MQEQRVKQGAERSRPRSQRKRADGNSYSSSSLERNTQDVMTFCRQVVMDSVENGVCVGRRNRFLSKLLGCHHVSHHTSNHFKQREYYSSRHKHYCFSECGMEIILSGLRKNVQRHHHFDTAMLSILRCFCCMFERPTTASAFFLDTM